MRAFFVDAEEWTSMGREYDEGTTFIPANMSERISHNSGLQSRSLNDAAHAFAGSFRGVCSQEAFPC